MPQTECNLLSETENESERQTDRLTRDTERDSELTRNSVYISFLVSMNYS